ncbi:hemicentin-1-like isoform X3 [Takifugu rubripes]|uniref:hemicentin-1-like isoform X3 n=1 Tax=Takifugu rubripes TaxID=31033 RepID=UPI001145D005|nr:hemicentin-1-like isoform X3 [Takifugu rubripes]
MRELWVSWLLFCFAVTSAEPTRIRMVVKEDSEVVLNCSASGSVRDQVVDWKKDDDVEVFLYSRGSIYGSGLSGQSPQFAGRVAHFPEALDLGNASIRIKKAEVRDSGIYTCTFPYSAPVLRSEISLVVECILKVRPPGEGASSEPLIRIFDGGPDRALLLCEVKGAHTRPAVQWQDSSGRVLPDLETESEERDGRFYVTVRAIVSSSGNYSCVVTQEEFCHQISSTTFVAIDCILKVRPPGEGASPEPLIRMVDGGPDRALLLCEVKGAHPKPAVQWQDSSGRVLPALETESDERDGRFYVTVRANASRSGDYSCVVTQEEFCHQISSTTFVPIVPILKVRPPGEGACPEPLIRIVDGGPDRALLQCEVKGAHTRPAVQWKDSSGGVLPAQETKSEERDGLFYVTVRAIVSRSGDYSCVVTQEKFCHQISSTTFVYIGQTPDAGASTGVFVGVTVSVVGVIGVVGFIVGLLVAIAAVFLYFKFKAIKGERAEASNQAAACGASGKFTANARTPAPDEESSSLKNQAPGSD